MKPLVQLMYQGLLTYYELSGGIIDRPFLVIVICPPEKYIKLTHSRVVIHSIPLSWSKVLESSCVKPVASVSFQENVELGVLVNSFMIKPP